MTAAPIATRLARFAVALRAAPPPPEALEAARLRLIDAIAVALVALGTPSVPRPVGARGLFGSGGETTAIGLAAPQPAAVAALHNGILIHGLEFDDTHLGAIIHGAPVVVPTALAAAERAGASGGALLTAIVLGWEVLIRLGTALRGELQVHGFQATPVCGPLAAAATAGHLMGLDEARIASAIGIAGSQSSGLFEFLASGATSKSLHGAWASLGGLVAAGLAADGMTGPPTILEGDRGIFQAFLRAPGGRARLDAAIADLGTRWGIAETRPKLAPCCHYVVPFLDCWDLLEQQGVRADAVRSITCLVDPRPARLICEPWAEKQSPPASYAAKWSLPYCVAARALRGRVDVDLFERPVDPALVDYARRIDWQPIEEGFPERYPGRIRVTLADGSTRETSVPDVLGSPGRPMPEQALRDKLRACAAGRLAEPDVAALLDLLGGIGTAPSLGPLAALLRRAAAS